MDDADSTERPHRERVTAGDLRRTAAPLSSLGNVTAIRARQRSNTRQRVHSGHDAQVPGSRPLSNSPTWRGLTVDERGLRYRPPGWLKWRPMLRFGPDGLAVVRRSGEATVFVWDGSPGEWRLFGVQGSRANRAGIRLAVGPKRGPFESGPNDVWLPSTWSTPPLQEMPALADFLAATPDARSGLGDIDRVTRLVSELSGREWRRPGPPTEPFMGDPLDLYVAVFRALSASNWRRFWGRPVRGEPRPELGATADRAWSLLARAVTERVTREDVEKTVQRHLDVAPWPFDVLV